MSLSRLIGFALCLGMLGASATVGAQTINISPANPQPGQTISVTLSAANGCALNNPVLQPPPPGPKWTNFVFQSINTVGVTCPAVVQPFSYTTTIGPLTDGAYSIEWQDFSLGSKVFDVTLPFNVDAPTSVGAPALSWLGLVALAMAIGGLGLYRNSIAKSESLGK